MENYCILYDPDLKQVVISQLKKLGGVSPAMLLVNRDIESLFDSKHYSR